MLTSKQNLNFIKTRKKIKNKHKKTQKIQKAGIRVINNISHDDAFKYFIENSTFSYYNRGYFGILILAKLKNGIQSPYRHIRTNGIKYVKHLLLKFFKIEKSTNPDVKNIDSTDIQREINVQQNIYISSLTHTDTLLEPICPCIVYSHSQPLNENYKQSFYKIISKSIINNKQVNDLFSDNVAFFAMEFMENYSPLSNYVDKFLGKISIDKALYTLDKLHCLGFIHNDFHNNNVLMINNYNYFGFEKGISNGRAIIIDFGITNIIKKPDKMDKKYRSKLLQQESYYAHPALFYSFELLDEEHKIVQDKYIAIFEKYYRCDIYSIIKSYNIYTGGNMSIPNSKFEPIIHKRVYKYNNNNLANQAEEELKKENPEKYNELINSIKDTINEEKHNPGYINQLFKNQINGLIDPAFTLPHNEKNNYNDEKLELMMD